MRRLQVLHLVIGAGQALLGVLQGGAQLVQLLLTLAHLLGKYLTQTLSAALNGRRGRLLPRARQVGILAGARRLVGGARFGYGFLCGGEALVQAGTLSLNVLRGCLQGLRLGASAGMFGARHTRRLRSLTFCFNRRFCRGLSLLNGLLGLVQFGAGAGHDLGCGAVCGGKFQGAGALSRVEQAVAGVLGARGVKNTPDSALTCALGEQVQGVLCGGGIRREQHTRQALTQRRGHASQGVLFDAGERGGILAERFNDLGCGADIQLAQLGGAGFGQGGFGQVSGKLAVFAARIAARLTVLITAQMRHLGALNRHAQRRGRQRGQRRRSRARILGVNLHGIQHAQQARALARRFHELTGLGVEHRLSGFSARLGGCFTQALSQRLTQGCGTLSRRRVGAGRLHRRGAGGIQLSLRAGTRLRRLTRGALSLRHLGCRLLNVLQRRIVALLKAGVAFHRALCLFAALLQQFQGAFVSGAGGGGRLRQLHAVGAHTLGGDGLHGAHARGGLAQGRHGLLAGGDLGVQAVLLLLMLRGCGTRRLQLFFQGFGAAGTFRLGGESLRLLSLQNTQLTGQKYRLQLADARL